MPSISNVIDTLSAYAKYRQGRGKKYAEPDTPFSYDEVTDAIKTATAVLKVSYKMMKSIEEKCIAQTTK